METGTRKTVVLCQGRPHDRQERGWGQPTTSWCQRLQWSRTKEFYPNNDMHSSIQISHASMFAFKRFNHHFEGCFQTHTVTLHIQPGAIVLRNAPMGTRVQGGHQHCCLRYQDYLLSIHNLMIGLVFAVNLWVWKPIMIYNVLNFRILSGQEEF